MKSIIKSSSLRTNNVKKQCMLETNWLILLVSIASFCIVGCIPTGQTNNKRQSQNTNWSKSKKQSQSATAEDIMKDNTLSDILEFEKRINSSSNNANNTTNKKKKATTSDDKYETLKRKQELMEEEFNESIYNVKEELLEIKKILSDVAADRIKPTAERRRYVSPNESNEASSVISSDEDNIINKTFIIKSEEAKKMLQNEEQKKATPKPEKTNNTAPNKNFKITKDSDKQTSNNLQNTAPINTDNSPPNNTADNNFSEVISKIAKGDYNNASKIINDKLKQTKDPAIISNCNYWLGEISFNQRDYAKSIAYFNAALENNSDKKDIAQARIAESYFRVGKNEEAKTIYKKLLKEHPQSTHSARAKKMLQQL